MFIMETSVNRDGIRFVKLFLVSHDEQFKNRGSSAGSLDNVEKSPSGR